MVQTTESQFTFVFIADAIKNYSYMKILWVGCMVDNIMYNLIILSLYIELHFQICILLSCHFITVWTLSVK